MIKGHWFCNNCDDVVFMSYQKISEKNVPCPDCGHLTCEFIPRKLNRKQIGEQWFSEMRRVIEDSTNPELPIQINHKKLL